MKQLPKPPKEYDPTHQGRVQESIYRSIADETVKKLEDIDCDGMNPANTTRAMFLGRLLMMSPNGTKYQLLVDNSGSVSTTTA
jgi:hypothetical protein